MIHALAAAALLLSQATAAEPRCVTREQVADIAVVVASEVIATAIEHCRPHVATTAFVAGDADDYLARLRAAADARRNGAVGAFAAASGGTASEAEIEAGVLGFAVFLGAVKGGLSAALQPEACLEVDRIAAALAPLPPENLGQIASSVFALAEGRARYTVEDGAADEIVEPAEAAEADEKGSDPRTPPLRLCPS